MSPEGGAGRHESIRLAMWTHQVVEYLLAALIVMQSINGGSAAPFIALTGGLLFLLNAVTDAPCGIARWIPPRLHRVLDAVVIAALVLVPIVSGTTQILAWALCFLAAGAVAWLNWHTQWTRPVRRPARPAPAGPDTPAAPSPKAVSVAESARALGATVDRTTRGASRAAGWIYGRSRARRAGSGEDPYTNA